MSSAAKVTVWTVAAQTVIEVDAADGETLDHSWCDGWANAGRQALAPWCSVGPGHASVRVDTDKAAPLVALAQQLSGG